MNCNGHAVSRLCIVIIILRDCLFVVKKSSKSTPHALHLGFPHSIKISSSNYSVQLREKKIAQHYHRAHALNSTPKRQEI